MSSYLIRALGAALVWAALTASAIAQGPTLSMSVPYDLGPQHSVTIHLEHGLGYIPQVQAVTGYSTIVPHVFVITETDVWVSLHNTIEPPSIVLPGTVNIYLW